MLRVFLLYRFDSTSAHKDFKPAIITMFHEVKENRQPINAIIRAVILLNVIFSRNSITDKMQTKIGAVYKSTAATESDVNAIVL